jgi:AmmeMemoRadiSam system protein B
MKEIRESVVAGTFYPERAAILLRDVKQYLDNVTPEKLGGEIVALIAPHAGYMYSGQVAAHAYKLIEGRTLDAVCVVAPSHRALFDGTSIYDRGGYRTPLGLVSVDIDLCKKMMEKRREIRFLPEAHAHEHALEVQIPFLQVALKSFKLIPLMMEPYWSWESCESLGSAISETVRGRNVLLVASSDLSHFHSYDKAIELDKIVLNHIERFDPQGLYQDLKEKRCEACGAAAILSVMLAARVVGADRGKVLKYLNSGDVSGDRNQVVGYGACALFRTAGGEG